MRKDTSASWRIRSVPKAIQRSLTRVAKRHHLTNAELLIAIEAKLRDGEWNLP